MALNATEIERLLALDDLGSLRRAVHRLTPPVALADLRLLSEHAARLCPAPRPLRLAVVHTYTSELLQPWLDAAVALQGLALETYHAPYGVVMGEAQAGSGLVAHQPEITLMLLQRTDLHPDLMRPLTELTPEDAAALQARALSSLQQLIQCFRAQPVGQLVVTLLPSPVGPALGLHDAQAERSETRFWHGLQDQLAQWLRASVPASTWLDLDELLLEVGRRRAFDARYWLTSRYPFSAEASFELARRISDVGTLLKAPRAKVLVLDADNTLWGGVIGEDGIDGIALGPDYPGNAYVAFQRRILDLQQRGFVLAMCSKNNEADIDQVLSQHPHQLLKAEHFVARRVNWQPKPDNLTALAVELNVGLESFIFVDDSDHECAAVRARLPQVEVVQVPKRPHEVSTCLDRVPRLEILSLTDEDRVKTTLYEAERKRQNLLDSVSGDAGDLGSHLVRLGMRMTLYVDERRHIQRLAQLTQKTNQFNLTTRRYDEQQIAAFMTAPDWLVLDFSLADVFGDAGIVGLALVHLAGAQRAELDSFMMSCRVIGRCAEDAFMHGLLRELQARGITHLHASYKPTPKNVLVQDFLPRVGFVCTQEDAGQRRFVLDLTTQPVSPPETFPIAIERVPTATF